MTIKRSYFASKKGKAKIEIKSSTNIRDHTPCQISLLTRDLKLNSESYVIVTAFSTGQCRTSIVQVEDTYI